MKTAREMAHLVLGWKGHAGGCFGCGEHQAICDDATAAIEARDAEWRAALGVATAALGIIADTYVLNGEAAAALTEISKLLASQPTGEESE